MDQYGPTSLTCFVSGLHPVSLEEFGGCQNDGSQLDKSSIHFWNQNKKTCYCSTQYIYMYTKTCCIYR